MLSFSIQGRIAGLNDKPPSFKPPTPPSTTKQIVSDRMAGDDSSRKDNRSVNLSLSKMNTAQSSGYTKIVSSMATIETKWPGHHNSLTHANLPICIVHLCLHYTAATAEITVRKLGHPFSKNAKRREGVSSQFGGPSLQGPKWLIFCVVIKCPQKLITTITI